MDTIVQNAYANPSYNHLPFTEKICNFALRKNRKGKLICFSIRARAGCQSQKRNMKYKEYKNLSYPQVGDDVLKFWKENQIFQASIDTREGSPTFTFYEGPPSANGTPGIHHVMARSMKDIFCRYKTLQGFQVKRKGGWDTHGLPVELQVEKELGITKEDIGKTISVAEYNEKCRQTVMKFTDQWNDLTEKMGLLGRSGKSIHHIQKRIH